MVSRRTLLLVLLAAAAALGWNKISAQEVATLNVPGSGMEDYYDQVWVVDARPYVWIRAESPDTTWLDPLRQNPDIYLWRNGERAAYHATIWQEKDVAHVDKLFRRKYGVMEQLRALVRTQPTVPIRLEPIGRYGTAAE
jgi:hypothetical protein